MPLSKSKGVVGIDLGHSAIKVVQIERNGTGYKVSRSGAVPTPPDAIKDGVVVDPDAVGAALKTALKEAHIHSGVGVIAASGGTVFVRQVPYPKMTASMLRESLKFEAGRYIPGSVDESYIEAEILGAHDDAHMSVVLVAAPRDLVGSRIAAVEKAGLEVHEVDIEAFASYRATVEMDPGRDLSGKTIALLDLGAAKTSVSVIQNGAFVMQRSLATGGRALTEALMSYFNLEIEDAESGKSVLDVTELLVGKPEDNPPLRVIQPQIDDLIRELKRSFNYVQSQANSAEGTPALAVEGVLLCGGGARLRGLAAYMEQKLGLPVQTVGAYDNPAVTHNGVHEDAGLDLTVAAGLALRPFAQKPLVEKARPAKRPFGKAA
ncbi:type IV pilus assembly protein PilM [bacterium]|nr:MAG: type IV pilus assembly protein PilM [bacterium]